MCVLSAALALINQERAAWCGASAQACWWALWPELLQLRQERLLQKEIRRLARIERALEREDAAQVRMELREETRQEREKLEEQKRAEAEAKRNAKRERGKEKQQHAVRPPPGGPMTPVKEMSTRFLNSNVLRSYHPL